MFINYTDCTAMMYAIGKILLRSQCYSKCILVASALLATLATAFKMPMELTDCTAMMHARGESIDNINECKEWPTEILVLEVLTEGS
jgi:hypothetical protein